MGKGRYGNRWVLVMGILVIVLGIIHNGATPLIAPDLKGLPKEVMNARLFMIVGTGAAVIFAGLLTVYCSFGLKESERMTWIIVLGVGVFMGILGIGAIITMPDNPFAYIILAFSILLIAPLWSHRKQFRKNVRMQPS